MSRELRIGDRIVYDEAIWQVAALNGTTITLRSSRGTRSVLLGHLTAEGFDRLGDTEPETAPMTDVDLNADYTTLLEALPPDVLDHAIEIREHMWEIETGFRNPHLSDEDNVAINPVYDPALHPMAAREHAKVEELRAAGWDRVSLAAVRKWRGALAREGLWGVVDKRRARIAQPLSQTDPWLLDAIREQRAFEVNESTGTRTRFRFRVEKRIRERVEKYNANLPDGEEPRELPKYSDATFYRALAIETAGHHTFGDATTRRTTAGKPQGSYTRTRALRPGELVQIDSTPLDVMAFDLGGTAHRVQLLAAVDVATRTIASYRISPTVNSTDAAVLIAQMLVPEMMRPGWHEALTARMQRVPIDRELTREERETEIAARPVIYPETLNVDKGFMSAHMLDLGARLAINIQPARPYTGSDKGIMERTFGSINSLFCQYTAGHIGRSVTHRGRHAQDQASFTIEQLEELFAEWVLVGWQPRPHEGLQLPWFGKQDLSPNEMYNVLVGESGFVPLPANADVYVSCLPIKWRTIQPYGVEIESQVFDGDVLDEFRATKSRYLAKRGSWPFHYNPGDLSQVYFQHPGTGNYHALRWVKADEIGGRPFSDSMFQAAREHVRERRGNHRSQAALAAALNELLDRAEAGVPSNHALARRDRTRVARVARDRETLRHVVEPSPTRQRTNSPDVVQDNVSDDDVINSLIDGLEADAWEPFDPDEDNDA